MSNTLSARAEILTRRTYNRPIEGQPGVFETWPQTIDRVIGHQRWLWERARGSALGEQQKAELEELRELMLERKMLTAGRTLWLGGTEVVKRRESACFNCSALSVETVYDVVDTLWLLLQGCGVGFRPVIGMLNGFAKPIPNVVVINSNRTTKGGDENNRESWDPITRTWTISVGDSAEAWAKSIGKLLAGKYPADTLVLDFSQIRPAGERLKGYGWISSGDQAIAAAYTAIAAILNRKAGQLLSRIDILDVVNWLGTILSSRRSAQIAILDYGEPEWHEFATAKLDYWKTGNDQRRQSNNTLFFQHKPSREELVQVFSMMIDSGGSEPGFLNMQAALARAPFFKLVNPCGEILLGNKSFCNLVDIDVAKFRNDSVGMFRAIYIAARANYRQTCVNLRDGILQESWHLNNEFLRLCGVGLTGIVRRPDLGPYDYRQMERTATAAATGMADELGLQRPKNITTVKPSGTLSKIMDTTEGIHKPLGRYIFNNVSFARADELVPILRASGYRVVDHPFEQESVLITLPVCYPDVPFDRVDGVDVNLDSAIVQLERYKLVQNTWTHQNTSNTISYSPEEAEDIVDWLMANWDNYVAVSFLFRTDPTKTAADLGYPYLPQEVVSQETYDAYTAKLKPIDLSQVSGFTTDETKAEENQECVGGACPVR